MRKRNIGTLLDVLSSEWVLQNSLKHNSNGVLGRYVKHMGVVLILTAVLQYKKKWGPT